MNDLVKRVHTRLDERLGALFDEARRRGFPPPCRAGCPWCCSEPVYAERREAALIAECVRNFPKAERERIHAATRTWVERFMFSSLADSGQPEVMAYRRLRLPCPLLTPEGLCSVYAHRPGACRTHIAKSDPKGCEDDRLRPRQPFLMTTQISTEALVGLLSEGEAIFDHLVLLLHHEFFGVAPESGASTSIRAVE